MPRHLKLQLLLAASLLQAGGLAIAQAKPLHGDLTVELRQVDDEAGDVVSTRPRTPPLAPQQVQVRNGEKAVLRMAQSFPVKWTQSVSQGGRSEGAGVSYGLVWMEAGQGFTVTPRWPGGKQPASLQIEVSTASVDASTGAELPDQQRGQLSTIVSVPLGQWMTVASTGGEQAQKGVYRSRGAGNTRQLIQVRVSAR